MGNRQPKLVHHGNITFVGWPCWMLRENKRKGKSVTEGKEKGKTRKTKMRKREETVMLKKFFIASTGNF